MLDWLGGMCHSDGGIGFFNDGAFGVAPELGQLREYADRLGFGAPEFPRERVVHFADSGYVSIIEGPVRAILDVARVGPDYLPGHAHADTLSFELSLFGQRVLVNSGTSCYAPGAQRLSERGTAAHNTVQVNGENSSEVWKAFRVARRGRLALW